MEIDVACVSLVEVGVYESKELRVALRWLQLVLLVPTQLVVFQAHNSLLVQK